MVLQPSLVVIASMWIPILAMAASLFVFKWLRKRERIAWNVVGVLRRFARRKDAQNGLTGEMAMAQALNKLMAKDCIVFHDIPDDRGNIDHVVIAPNAVFAVETKWRSKREDSGAKGAEVHYDGKTLVFPGGYRTDAELNQAKACAKSLAHYLSGRTGQLVRVVPVVAFPGWFIKQGPGASSAEVKVIMEKWDRTFLNYPGSLMPQAQRNRIISALTDRYPELEA